jgi:ankyrin repeat protein
MHIQAFYRMLVDEEVFSAEEMREGPAAVAAGGDGPLHCAVYYGDAALVSELVELGADIDSVGEFGFTPLHCAAFRGDADMICLLLRAGADISVESDFGETALNLAEAGGKSDAAHALRTAT